MNNTTHSIDELYSKSREFRMIGILFKNPAIIFQLPWFKPEYLYSQHCRVLYKAIFILLENGHKKISDFVLKDVIDKTEDLKKNFYTDENSITFFDKAYCYFDKLIPHNVDLLEEYKLSAQEVVSFAYKRDVVQHMRTLEEQCFSMENENINTLHLKIQTAFNNLSETYIVNKEIKPFCDTMDDTWEEIKRMRNGGVYGIRSNYNVINEYFTYQPGELTVIGGRAKEGKSTFFLNEILHKLEAYPNMGCAIFDTEMGERNILPRMLSIKSGVSSKDIVNGTYENNPEDVKKVEDAREYWRSKRNFIHIYDTQWTYEKIFAASTILKTDVNFNLGFLVFDYIKDTGSKDFSGEKLNYALGSFTNFLKNEIAGHLDIPVMAGAQLSPYNIRLADSDSVNRYASTVAYWLRQDDNMKSKRPSGKTTKQCGNYCMTIGYNRIGEALQDSYMNFYYNGKTGLILESEWQACKYVEQTSGGDDGFDEEL